MLVTGDWSAEVYDPTTNGWSLATEEEKPSGGYTATLLEDGRVLVTGGGVVGTSTAGVYDPESRRWEELGELNIRRTGHTATLLKDGRVLVAGGVFLEPRGPSIGVARAELYDPATGTWSLSGEPTNSATDPLTPE
ncbi:MAG TPA: kelch repeat-containing protein [Archangium sp.]|nr:kelch repeat-containing protein [Archangium sp.]